MVGIGLVVFYLLLFVMGRILSRRSTPIPAGSQAKDVDMVDWTGDLHPLNLAAIVYHPADDVDDLLASFAGDLVRAGRCLGGIVQRNVKGERGQRERMEVIDLMTGRTVRICQYLGKDAAACKLNPAGLAEAATLVSRAVNVGVELVVVNKFSKQEAAGRGLRAEIAEAVMAGLPLLTAVSYTCYEAWTRFTGGFGTTLLCERGVVEDWWEEMSVRARQARIAASAREASLRVALAPALPEPAVVANVPPLLRPSTPSLADYHVR
jgi:molybdate transport system ATP-binding protein